MHISKCSDYGHSCLAKEANSLEVECSMLRNMVYNGIFWTHIRGKSMKCIGFYAEMGIS
jgi:hypothetical protein